MLDLSWDLMCPLCRGAKDSVSSLSELRSSGHCSSCNIQFDANFDRSVEVTFRPTEQIRRTQPASYCVGGPGNTPHILFQRSIEPQSTASLTLDLREGTYRLRGPRISGGALLEVGPAHPSTGSVSFSCSPSGMTPQVSQIAPGTVSIAMENPMEEEMQVLLEDMRWPEDAATAAQVTALQDFRDLFSSEVLAPDEEFEVRYLTFMFTDLRSSTALYRERGDAPAYAMVRDHFQVLQELIPRHSGAVVKTIGDAVMAVFREPGDAVAAGLAIHDAFSESNEKLSALVLKVGVHAGPCMAVNLNGRLDYFGTTVNTAVRLEGHSAGGDVTLRAELLEDPAIRELVTAPGIETEGLVVELKGFEEPARICRVRRIRQGAGELN